MQGRLERIEELFAPDHVLHVIGSPEIPGEGRPILRLARLYRRAAPDLAFKLQHQFAAGDRVVTQFEVSGTQHGYFGPVAPSHRFVSVEGVEIVRVAAGKIAETWLYADLLGAVVQIGAIAISPPPPPTRAPAERQ